MDPDDRLLRYFLAVAEELNFTRAAERLHIAQPSLSAQIRQLEAQLGTQLLRRSTHAVSLTEAGRALQLQGPRAVAELERAWQAARDAGNGTAGHLRLAYTFSAGHDTVPRLVEALHEAHPGITLATHLLPSPQVLHAVRDGSADVGVARAPAAVDGVRLRPIRRDAEGTLLAADHPLAEAQTVTLSAVADYPVVLHPRSANPAHHDFIQQLFSSRGLQPCFLERDIAFDLSQQFIAGSTAIAVVGRSTSVRLPPDLRWVPLAEPVSVTVVLAVPARDQTATARRFEDLACSHADAHGWLEPGPAAGSGSGHSVPGSSTRSAGAR